MLDWLRRLTPAIYQRVQQRGLVDVEADGMRVTVEQHLQEWSRFLRDANRTVLQAEQQRMRAATLLDGCLRLADIDAARIQRRLESLRQDRGWSQRTRNAYLKAAQQFERWLVKQGRATALGLTRLDVVRVTAERERRALTPDEACRLLAYCEDAPTLAGHTWSLTGEQRRLLYLVAMKTGLRANELRCLRRADVVGLHDLEVEGGGLLVAEVAGHTEALEHASRERARADRARRTVVLVIAVAGALTAEVVALHAAGETLAAAHRDDIDPLARGERVDGDLLADLKSVDRIETQLDQLAAR
jgi:integrase